MAGRPRTKPIKKYVQQLIDKEGCTTLKDFARKKDIPYGRFLLLADPEKHHPELADLADIAKKCGCTIDELVYGILNSSA